MSENNINKYNFIVDADDADIRIDKYLSEACKDLSRSYIQKIISDGGVLLNGEVPKAKTIVSEDDTIEICVPESVIPEILPENIPLDIIYEDSDVVVVNKPKGMVVHPAAGHYSGTLVNALLYHCSNETWNCS